MKNQTTLTTTFWFAHLFFLIFHSVSSIASISGIDTGFSDEPLPPDQAFVMTSKVLDTDMIRTEWHIVDGYYMYRDKFKFESNTPGIAINPGIYPKGKIKEDEFFGKVETYRGNIVIDIPLSRLSDVDTLAFTVTSQGCADIGICYPPQTQETTLSLPALPMKTATASLDPSNENTSFNPFAALKKFGNSLGLGASDNKFLPPDQAFIFSADIENGNLIKANWKVAEGYYLYRDKFAFSLEDSNGITIGHITMPKGEEKVDEAFGKMIVYHKNISIDIPLLRTNLDATPISLVAKYQGCADAGFCYPPIQQVMPLSLPKGQAMQASLSTTQDVDQGSSDIIVSEQDQIAASLASGNTLLTILTFFGFGLLLAFTPCVFPMVPILSSIIIGQGKNITTRKAFTMSLVYVLAMAVTYTVAGVIAGIFGENLQAAFQNPWVLGSFSVVFVALAFSMFGFYDIQMPNFVQSKLTEYSNKQQGGTLIGVAIMGFLSALIVGPCVAAPLAGALIYIGQTGDAVLGGMALFALSLGMGAPLLAIGVSAGKLLPKAGTWMDAVKAVFGVMMLAVAIWMLERIVPAAVSMSLWAMLLIVSAIYMGALEPVGGNSTGWRKLWKGLGVVVLVYGALLLIGVASGGKDALQPLSGGFITSGGTGGSQSHQELVFTKVKGLEGLERELTKATAQGKIVMLDFYADWCVSCKEMEKYTFSDPGVQQALKNVVLLQTDVTLNDKQDKALLSQFGLFGPPSILFFDKQGQEQRAYRLVGFLNAEKFEAHVQKISNI
ncbi:MAG: protein-disulfide reductase DsbD [Gammaproteobacteria bacterium]|nr:protein-disulfide reductase DsbD [Gammaproteobacteria bacterium]